MAKTTTTPRRKTENDENADENVDWRTSSSPTSPPKSHGISPSKFHHQKRGIHLVKKEEEKVLQKMEEMHESVEERLLQQEKRDHSSKLAMQRAAFKQLTCLQTWPLQDMAMQHLDELLGNIIPPSKQIECSELSNLSESSSASSSSSSSGASSVEAKRCMRQLLSSPAKSRLKRHYHDQFLLQQQQQPDEKQEPLWSMEPRVFATEKANGKRKYLVGHFGRIMDMYWRKSYPKHFYEVIREQTPCRLYFDLEYSRIYNTDIDSDALMNDFRAALTEELKSVLDVDLSPEAIVDLDSSNETKFSKHWIVHLPGLFEDAPAVGRFVKHLVGRLAEEVATEQLQGHRPTLAKHLFVKTKDPSKTSCFIDLGVYTRNRLFRILGSSKFGKTSALEMADSNSFPIELPPQKPPTKYSSLEDFVAANDWTQHARVLAETLVVPLFIPKDAHIFKLPEDTVNPTRQKTSFPTVRHPSVPIRTTSTPLPTLDKYVSEILAARGGVQGAIRAWSMEYGAHNNPISITYQLVRNRFCELIGRSHKSNNIYWTIDFQTWSCVQGCHDPECFGRGIPKEIAASVLPMVQGQFQQWQEEEFEKALLALNLDDTENQQTGGTEEVGNAGTRDSRMAEEAKNYIIDKKSHPASAEHEDIDTSTTLSDDALLDAVLSNPELFP
jgi:hypothetical protein